MKPKKIHYTWPQFAVDIKKFARAISKKKRKFNGVWGPARGGLPIAVCLSHLLDLPFLSAPKDKNTLIVDDIADTGVSLEKFAKKGYFIATIFYHRQCSYVPRVWLREKKHEWVIFPWERD